MPSAKLNSPTLCNSWNGARILICNWGDVRRYVEATRFLSRIWSCRSLLGPKMHYAPHDPLLMMKMAICVNHQVGEMRCSRLDAPRIMPSKAWFLFSRTRKTALRAIIVVDDSPRTWIGPSIMHIKSWLLTEKPKSCGLLRNRHIWRHPRIRTVRGNNVKSDCEVQFPWKGETTWEDDYQAPLLLRRLLQVQ